MAWKQSGQPTIQQQRGKWVARVEGVDTENRDRQDRAPHPIDRLVKRHRWQLRRHT